MEPAEIKLRFLELVAPLLLYKPLRQQDFVVAWKVKRSRIVVWQEAAELLAQGEDWDIGMPDADVLARICMAQGWNADYVLTGRGRPRVTETPSRAVETAVLEPLAAQREKVLTGEQEILAGKTPKTAKGRKADAQIAQLPQPRSARAGGKK